MMLEFVLASALAQTSTMIDIPVPEGFEHWRNAYSGKQVTSVRCHETMREPLLEALQCLKNNNWAKHLKLYNGCYVYRNIAGTDRLSNHAYGKAIDINAFTDQSPEVVTCFKEAGFTWGGDWKTAYDPMHFEYTKK